MNQRFQPYQQNRDPFKLSPAPKTETEQSDPPSRKTTDADPEAQLLRRSFIIMTSTSSSV